MFEVYMYVCMYVRCNGTADAVENIKRCSLIVNILNTVLSKFLRLFRLCVCACESMHVSMSEPMY